MKKHKSNTKNNPECNTTDNTKGNRRTVYTLMQKQLLILTMGTFLMSCAPTVKVEAPDKPITINLNVKIEHEIRVKVDKELDDVFSDDSGLF